MKSPCLSHLVEFGIKSWQKAGCTPVNDLYCILVLGNVQSKDDYFNTKPGCPLIVQHSKNKTWHYKGFPEDHPCLDLIFADIPEGLPVVGISNPPSSILAWNQESKEWLQPLFDFADEHMHNDGAIILFHPFRMSTKSNILGYCKLYGFAIRKEWRGMNRLHLTSPINPASTVR